MDKRTMIKIFIDTVMTILLLLLMAYMLIGENSHEVMGIIMGILFVIHNILNLKWYKNIFRGNYTLFRALQLILNILLLFTMTALMISGIILSKYAFTFMSISKGASIARPIHLLCSYWGFALLSLHLGLHWSMIMGMTRHLLKITDRSLKRTILSRGLAIAIVGYGIYSFKKNDLFSYMTLKSEFVFFDFEMPLPLFFSEYLAMMGMWIFIAYYLTKFILYLQKK